MTPLSLGQCAALACVLEATAPKPGNVHRGADFEDLTYGQFSIAATMIAPALEAAPRNRVGATVLAAIAATRAATGTNVNLGMVLLMAPLATVPRDVSLRSGVAQVLANLNTDDARDVYAAIQLAHPGGMGTVSEADVHGAPPADLIAAMRLAAERDLVARQYTNGFAQVFDCVLPWLVEAQDQGWPLLPSIVHVFLRLMSEYPDSLITRKCGQAVAEQAARRAAAVLASGPPDSEAYEHAAGDLDFWLRSDHHRRNPGTSADLVAAGLFAALRDGIIRAPFRLN